jgi:hypothetical protein
MTRANVTAARKAGSKTAFAAIILLAAIPCAASAMSGRDLLGYCLSENQVEKTGCMLYITGFVQGAQMHSQLSDRLCLPENLTGEEAVAVFVRKLREMAQASNKLNSPPPEAKQFFSESAIVSVTAALGLQYGCKR